ncbi:unnamed protein product [Rotaria magnacalcarata]|uniref:Uncharacterized protein n=1 Tax=Rotaria magnacalcarata TaxID=392030 RepID=A0A816UXP9_9BILA|nr:unnamed protein product [Rotaria magnacalcarata]
MSDSCHHEKSDSTNPTSTSDTVEMNKKIGVKVGNDQGNISFTTIKTDAVGPCHFFLLTGILKKRKFSYVKHTSKDYAPSIYSATSILIHIVVQIAHELQLLFPIELRIDATGFQFNEIHKLQMLAGGSVPLYPNLIHNGYLLVNNVYNNMQIQEQMPQQLSQAVSDSLSDGRMILLGYDSQLHQQLSMHLIKQLKGNIKILPPITFFTPDPELDEEEEIEDTDVCDAPAICIAYDCETHCCDLGLEWISTGWSCELAYMDVDLNDKDRQEYIWKKEKKQMDMAESLEGIACRGKRLKNRINDLTLITTSYIQPSYGHTPNTVINQQIHSPLNQIVS